MRTANHAELARLTEHLGEMCGMAGVAMEHATQALLQADLVLSEQVLTAHDKIATMSTAAEENAFALLAPLHAPPINIDPGGCSLVGNCFPPSTHPGSYYIYY